MPIISVVGRRTRGNRLLIGAMYVLLALLGVTMVVPFMITLAGSVSNDFDYEHFRPIPRAMVSRPDRFVKGLVLHFNKYPKWYEQMAASVPGMPKHWTSWREIGRDEAGIAALAAPWLRVSGNEPCLARQAADYSTFLDTLDPGLLTAPVSNMDAAMFLSARSERDWLRKSGVRPTLLNRRAREEGALEEIRGRWGSALDSFYAVDFEKSEGVLPYWQQSWFPPETPKYDDYLLLADLYRQHYFTPAIAGRWRAWAKAKGLRAARDDMSMPWTSGDPETVRAWSAFKAAEAPAARAVPFAMRAVWRAFLQTEEAAKVAGFPEGRLIDIDAYNRLAGSSYRSFGETPFPAPPDAPPALAKLWTFFVETRYPVRLTTLDVSPALENRYRAFLAGRFKTIRTANDVLETAAAGWKDFALSAVPPSGKLLSVWMDFVKGLPAAERRIHSPEHAWQAFLREKYGSAAAVNAAHGTSFARLEESFPPFAAAYAVTFAKNEWGLSLRPMTANYAFILSYLLKRGRAVFVTLTLIALTILMTLTVNPMCAYALSRFNLPGKDKLILYLLATMAFPAMVSAIPAYLLMRDIGLLNTFFALLLPGAANGMSIFILKGFFDSLPPELFEAATIDGASEWQIFRVITLPLMTPILAINALNAFIAAYNGWEWALIICQNRNMWTLSVWMYQANQLWAMDYPWIVTAGFVVVSIPTLLVFLFCQKIILRGIILPQMK